MVIRAQTDDDARGAPRELWPVLDVDTTYASAIALYERCGWTRLGTIALPMPDGRPIAEHVYAAPAPL
jgi:hypothetical protein